jgi:hypothetical protein
MRRRQKVPSQTKFIYFFSQMLDMSLNYIKIYKDKKPLFARSTLLNF